MHSMVNASPFTAADEWGGCDSTVSLSNQKGAFRISRVAFKSSIDTHLRSLFTLQFVSCGSAQRDMTIQILLHPLSSLPSTPLSKSATQSHTNESKNHHGCTYRPLPPASSYTSPKTCLFQFRSACSVAFLLWSISIHQ